MTGASATVVEYLREDPEVAFETSTNDLPYRGVRGAGTTSIAPGEDKTVLRSLIERYLGDTDSQLANYLLSPDRDEVRITIDIERTYVGLLGPDGRRRVIRIIVDYFRIAPTPGSARTGKSLQ